MFSLLIVTALLVVSQVSSNDLGDSGASVIGPSTRNTVFAPDGRVVSSSAQAGIIRTNGPPVAATSSLEIIPAGSPSYITSSGSGTARRTVVAGPSGTITTSNAGRGAGTKTTVTGASGSISTTGPRTGFIGDGLGQHSIGTW